MTDEAPGRTGELLEAATRLHRGGDLAAARRMYAEVLALEPGHPVALFRSGLLALQEGQPDAAFALISRAAAVAPDEPRYQVGMGQVLQILGRWSEAATIYRRLAENEPQSADAQFGLGIALQSQSQHPAAIAAFERATQLRTDFAEAFNNLGLSRQLTGQLAPAAAAYERALVLRPADATCMGNLGTVLREMGELDRAVAWLRRAVAAEPSSAAHTVNLAVALNQRREFAEAESVLKDTVAREPSNAEAAFNRAHALRGLGRPYEAVASYRQAISIRPDYAGAWNNLGNVYKELGDLPNALVAFESAITARPDYVIALNNLGCLLRTLGRSDDAEDVLRRGLRIDGRHAALHDNLASVLKDAGDLDAAIDHYRQALAIDSDNAATHSNLAYALSFQSPEAAPILEQCREWNRLFAEPLRRAARAPAPHACRNGRLKIGYVSADFRDHCQSLFTTPLLAHHDHSRFDIYCYSSVERPDEYTRRLAGYADRWREIRMSSDSELCEVIHADGIQVLVDLTMHMAGNRLQAFARKPAPVQISWLAYPGTTGIGAIDYRLSDPRLDPDGFDAHYSERTLRLADSFWCYDPLTQEPAVGPLPALMRGYLTLGCLNNPCKLTERTLGLWGGVMRAIASARLMLMAPPGRHRLSLGRRLEAQGIAAERVDFVGFRPRAEYLRSYDGIDVALDTVPYNGHTTSLDAAWMGVPTVTRVGRTCVGRGGLSQLYNLGLLDLAAETDQAFIDAVRTLAGNLPRLAELRRGLRARLESSAIMDAPRFARTIEAAYVQAWQNYTQHPATG